MTSGTVRRVNGPRADALQADMKTRHLLLPLGCALLTACQSRTNVSATGNAPAVYTHVYLTVTQIGFNASATASPSASGWTSFTLTAPQTLDLVALANGGLAQLTNQLSVNAGSYAQMRVVLADTAAALTASAQAAGAQSNNEVDYYDVNGTLQQAPLQVVNFAQGIGFSASLDIVGQNVLSGAASSSAASSSSSASSSAPTTTVLVDFDATRDLTPLSLNGQAAFLLSPHPFAVDQPHAGIIQGQLNLSGVALNSAGVADVQVAAETLSADGTRHVVAQTTLASSSGSFSLYPLSTATGQPTQYDLVIHGPAITTVIVKSVPVASGTPGSGTAQLGTITLIAATPFAVNVNGSQPVSPSSAAVGFYQTLPLSGEVPYLVEQRATDPTSGVFAQDQQLSAGGLEYATFSSTGASPTLSSATPAEGQSSYRLAALNPAWGEGTLNTLVAPAAGGATALFTVGALPPPSGATIDSINGNLQVGGNGSYNQGALMLTYNGALVAAASLNSLLGGSAGTLAAAVPGGAGGSIYSPGVYYAEVWVWNSSNPSGTLTRVPYGSAVDLSSGGISGLTLSAP